MPSKKWWAARVVALGTLATAYFQAGEWSTTLSVMAVGIAVGGATAWLLPNAEEDGEKGLTLVEVLVVLLIVLVVLLLVGAVR